ncbi:MAG: hypothetical protein AB1746_11355, partial [Candidatus Zixiibacteriota bacterium]
MPLGQTEGQVGPLPAILLQKRCSTFKNRKTNPIPCNRMKINIVHENDRRKCPENDIDLMADLIAIALFENPGGRAKFIWGGSLKNIPKQVWECHPLKFSTGNRVLNSLKTQKQSQFGVTEW